MLVQMLAVVVCLSVSVCITVCLYVCVCLSVTRRYCIKTAARIDVMSFVQVSVLHRVSRKSGCLEKSGHFPFELCPKLRAVDLT